MMCSCVWEYSVGFWVVFVSIDRVHITLVQSGSYSFLSVQCHSSKLTLIQLGSYSFLSIHSHPSLFTLLITFYFADRCSHSFCQVPIRSYALSTILLCWPSFNHNRSVRFLFILACSVSICSVDRRSVRIRCLLLCVQSHSAMSTLLRPVPIRSY